MRVLLLVFALLMMVLSCEKDRSENVPNVDPIEVDFSIHRYEQALLQMDTFAPINSFRAIRDRFPALTDLYFSQVVGMQMDPGFNGLAKDVNGMVKDHRVRFLLDTIQVLYPNLTAVHDEFERAFKYLKYYFPEQNVPDVYTLASEYTVGTFLFSDEEGNDALGVGLDFFLGSDYPYHLAVPNNTAFSRYLTRTFNRDHMVKKALVPLIQDWLGRADGSRLLDKMIHDGKERYLLDKLMPFVSDTVIHEYSLGQLTFCEENEADMWAFFLTEDLLYTQEPHKISKYINPAPKSAGMPDAAPGRSGGYIGYKVVQQYMLRNPELTLTDLIQNRDAQEILKKSKYRPRNKE